MLWDIQNKREDNKGALPGKTVINFSSAYAKDVPENGVIQNTTTKIMQQIMDLGVPIVVTAGNSGTDDLDPPARWADENLKLIVASSVDRSFERSSFSNAGKQTTIWGIGSQNVVASKYRLEGYSYNAEGTSFGK